MVNSTSPVCSVMIGIYHFLGWTSMVGIAAPKREATSYWNVWRLHYFSICSTYLIVCYDYILLFVVIWYCYYICYYSILLSFHTMTTIITTCYHCLLWLLLHYYITTLSYYYYHTIINDHSYHCFIHFWTPPCHSWMSQGFLLRSPSSVPWRYQKP